MKLSDYVAEFIAKYIKHVFVGNGGCVVHLLDSLDRKLKVVPCQHEQGAAIAAEAYARLHGMGVAVATSGPGMINLIQGIACAYYDSIPVVFISGAAPTSQLKGERKVRQFGFQEMDVVALTKPITKYSVLLTDPQNIKYELEKLFMIARAGRPGPVMLDLPDDLQRAEIEPEKLRRFEPVEPERDRLAQYFNRSRWDAEIIAGSKRPVVVVGSGARSESDYLRIFLQRTGLPYASTWATIDMFQDDEPNYIGNFGVSANRASNLIIQNADLIISLGSRMDTHQIGSKAELFAPGARKIMVDIDCEELVQDYGLAKKAIIHNDSVDSYLFYMVNANIHAQQIDCWLRFIRKVKEFYPICLSEYHQQTASVNPYVFMDKLSALTSDGDIIITDAGATLTWTMQGYKMRHKQRLFSAFNHSPMGYALPASIGAHYAKPKSRIICITGDGGMQMNVQELETIAHNKLPIKIFVMNNEEYGIIKQTQDTWLAGRHVASDPASGLGFPDIRKVARAYGIKTMVIRDHKDLGVIEKVLRAPEAVLCDVKIKHGEKIIPKLEFGRGIDDMSPPLSREEHGRVMSLLR